MKNADATAEDIQAALDDLEVQSMLLGMDIDIETLTLTPQSDYKEPIWITRWKEKESGKDYSPIDNGF